MNADELARATTKLDAAAFIRAHRTPALVFLVPRIQAEQETACSARALFFGQTNSFGRADATDVAEPDDDATQAGSRAPRVYEIVGGSNIVFLDTSINGAFTMGRATSNKLCLPVPTVSKVHAQLEFGATVSYVSDDDEANALWQRHDELGAPTGWLLRDLGSSNGTFVDDRQLPRSGERVLEDGVVIGVGPDVKMKFLVPRTLWRFCVAYRETMPIGTS